MSQIVKEQDRTIVIPGVDIVASMANDFRTELQNLIQDSSGDIELDLAGVEMVDSVGIGVIIATHNSLTRQNRRLKVVNVARDIYSLFSTMRLDRHFSVEPLAS
ncbi:STAS domain-containing protein [Desulfobotulus sp. H1]|uniref:STAS domain-containing protein n=1 Tax=Desulfobotulus pelophilus TaxID=2823377 RepID=A0ABT3NC78_9BACT|nr:STAS domain-containing protein [Desulfobotulus pelophilus]MCW7755058.1 STAS domain-containing protein [Desulfobotulus pelophilus]